jgi:hypothetical protein
MTTRAGSRRCGDDVASVVAALRAEGAAIVDELLQRNANRWESPSARDRRRIEEVARSIVDRLLSEPAQRAASFTDEDQHARAEALRELFGLEAGSTFTPLGRAARSHARVPARRACVPSDQGVPDAPSGNRT